MADALDVIQDSKLIDITPQKATELVKLYADSLNSHTKNNEGMFANSSVMFRRRVLPQGF